MAHRADEHHNVIELTELIQKGSLTPGSRSKDSSAPEAEGSSLKMPSPSDAGYDTVLRIERLSSRLSHLEQLCGSFEQIQKQTQASLEENLQSILLRLEQMEGVREKEDALRLERVFALAGDRNEEHFLEILSKIDTIEAYRPSSADQESVIRTLRDATSTLNAISSAVSEISRQNRVIQAKQDELAKAVNAMKENENKREAWQEKVREELAGIRVSSLEQDSAQKQIKENLDSVSLRLRECEEKVQEDTLKKVTASTCAKILREEIASIRKK